MSVVATGRNDSRACGKCFFSDAPPCRIDDGPTFRQFKSYTFAYSASSAGNKSNLSIEARHTLIISLCDMKKGVVMMATSVWRTVVCPSRLFDKLCDGVIRQFQLIFKHQQSGIWNLHKFDLRIFGGQSIPRI